MRLIQVDTPESWHDQRSKHLGASEIPAFFCQDYYTTPYELWLAKSGKVKVELVMTDSMRAGIAHEAAVLDAINRKHLEPPAQWARPTNGRLYWSDEQKRLGATLDGIIPYPQENGLEMVRQGYGRPAQVKFVSARAFKEQFTRREDGSYEPPLKYALQVQQELLLTGADFGYLFVAVISDFGFKYPAPIAIHTNKKVHGMIEQVAAKFWDMVDTGKEPQINVNLEGDAIALLFQNYNPTKSIIADNSWEDLLERYAETKAVFDEHKKAFEGIQNEMKLKLEQTEAERVDGSRYSVTVSTITQPEHVRKATTFKRLNFKAKKGE